jgi:two-component system cell cycle response regulator DivK
MPNPNPPRTIRVLVVDDFPDGRELLAEYLTFRGFDVQVACGGADAIEIVRTAPPEIVLLDLSMPGLDGWQTARLLKHDPETSAIMVIAVTARALKSETDAAMAAGCDGVVCKPFDLATLADALPRVLSDGVSVLSVPGLSLNAAAPKKKARRIAESL